MGWMRDGQDHRRDPPTADARALPVQELPQPDPVEPGAAGDALLVPSERGLLSGDPGGGSVWLEECPHQDLALSGDPPRGGL